MCGSTAPGPRRIASQDRHTGRSGLSGLCARHTGKRQSLLHFRPLRFSHVGHQVGILQRCAYVSGPALHGQGLLPGKRPTGNLLRHRPITGPLQKVPGCNRGVGPQYFGMRRDQRAPRLKQTGAGGRVIHLGVTLPAIRDQPGTERCGEEWWVRGAAARIELSRSGGAARSTGECSVPRAGLRRCKPHALPGGECPA